MNYPSILKNRFQNSLNEDSLTPQHLPSEIELQSLWFNGQFGRQFLTTDGKAVEIIQFGDWNRGAGPDFLRATIKLNSETLHGPLEIDTRPSDWVQHQHASNPTFDETVLHVLFTNEATTTFTRTSNHRCVPRIILTDDNIRPALQRPFYTNETTYLGRCSTPLKGLCNQEIETFMEQAVKHRLSRKRTQLARTAETHGEQQSLWLSIAETLGYRQNRLSMTILAQRLPIQNLSQQEENILTLIFGTAGYLHPDIHEEAQHDAKQWLRHLWDSWWQIRQNFELEQSRNIPWSRAAIRPVNHPQRRLAALVCIAKEWVEFQKIVSSPKDCQNFLLHLNDNFWNHHYTLTSKPSAKPLRLIGKDRAQSFLINHIYPKLLEPSLEPDFKTHWNNYKNLPALSCNEKVSKAARRLFGDHPSKSNFLKKAWQHQALLQIYEDFCLVDTTECAECPFPEQLPDWIKSSL